MNHNDDQNPQELTPEQQAAVEESVQKTLKRINKAKTIWKKIKTPVMLAGAATGGFILRGVLTEQEECPYQEYEEIEADDHDETPIEQE